MSTGSGVESIILAPWLLWLFPVWFSFSDTLLTLRLFISFKKQKLDAKRSAFYVFFWNGMIKWVWCVAIRTFYIKAGELFIHDLDPFRPFGRPFVAIDYSTEIK